jgi:predicted SAM-dependent methyltransferase
MTVQARRPLIDTNSDLLNIGCGRNAHTQWTNLDLVAAAPGVHVQDIRRGLPFTDGHFRAVYHSHLLEHLTPHHAGQLMQETWRVLRPGGVLRIVVPDLERIARTYLETLSCAWAGGGADHDNYQWMKLELLDQLVRTESGGQMGRYMTDPQIRNVDFVRSRIGNEYQVCHDASRVVAEQRDGRGRASLATRLKQRTKRARRWLALTAMRVLGGVEQATAAREGLFRDEGEIHRWMYDRLDLRSLCESHGFSDFQLCSASESRIEGFESFDLDTVDGVSRKPDSLYAECRKPAAPASATRHAA